jgi:hypothetical protein
MVVHGGGIKMSEDKRNIRTSVILSPRAMDILNVLVHGHAANSKSEAVDNIVGGWARSDHGKKVLDDAKNIPRRTLDPEDDEKTPETDDNKVIIETDEKLMLFTVTICACKSIARPQEYEFIIAAENEDEAREIAKDCVSRMNIISFYNTDVIYIDVIGVAVKGLKKGIRL